MNIHQKKQIIESALSPWFQGEHLLEAVLLWELRYSQQPTLAFQRYLSEICITPSLAANRNKMLQALLRSFTDETGRLVSRESNSASAPSASDVSVAMTDLKAPISTPQPPARQAETERHDPGSQEALTACLQLINAVFMLTPGDMSTQIRERLHTSIPALTLSPDSREALEAWLSDGSLPEGVGAREATLRDMVLIVRNGLCEFVSPARADRLLLEAREHTERYYRGSFSLRRLWAA